MHIHTTQDIKTNSLYVQVETRGSQKAAAKVKQVIEQDGVLILETVETDPNDPEALPQVCT